MTNRDQVEAARDRYARARLYALHAIACSHTDCRECKHGCAYRAGEYADCTASWLAAGVGDPLSINVIWFPKPDKDPNPL